VLKFMTASLLMLPPAFGQVSLTTAQIAKRVSPSVVVIQGKTDSGDVLGSGFIVSKDGKIVTNLHVIQDLKVASVQLSNGEIFDSMSILATDERRDLAIVRIAGFELAALELGNSNSLTVGEPVVVVGSPRGLDGTVTAGILSSVRDSGDGFKVLQTDAAVNPGNSGGPLVNSKGQAVGVVSFKLRSSEGLNFAIPISYVRGLLNELHEPVSLDQMRTSLSARPTANQQSSGPSLKETLEWLKGTVPLSIYQYGVTYSNLGPSDTTVRTVPVRLEACTVVLDVISKSIPREPPLVTVTYTTRYTIPLGALDKGYAFKLNKQRDDIVYKADGWVVPLQSKSQVILSENHEDLGNTTKSESLDFFALRFNDESMAKRVQEAFNHAADLCRGKEPF
jgi:hypothetical protein